MKTDMYEKFLTVSEAAAVLRLAPRTVLNELSRKRRGLPAGPLGDLPALRIGRRILIPAVDFDGWLAENLRHAAGDDQPPRQEILS